MYDQIVNMARAVASAEKQKPSVHRVGRPSLPNKTKIRNQLTDFSKAELYLIYTMSNIVNDFSKFSQKFSYRICVSQRLGSGMTDRECEEILKQLELNKEVIDWLNNMNESDENLVREYDDSYGLARNLRQVLFCDELHRNHKPRPIQQEQPEPNLNHKNPDLE